MSSLRATDGYNEAAFEDGSGYVNNWSAPAEDDDDGFYADQILRDAGIYVAPYVAPESVRRGTLPPLFRIPRSICNLSRLSSLYPVSPYIDEYSSPHSICNLS